jgi:hypothetical protein
MIGVRKVAAKIIALIKNAGDPCQGHHQRHVTLRQFEYALSVSANKETSKFFNRINEAVNGVRKRIG